jgi:hypothetical protein
LPVLIGLFLLEEKIVNDLDLIFFKRKLGVLFEVFLLRQGFGLLVFFWSELVEVTKLVEVFNAGDSSEKVVFIFMIDFSLDSFSFFDFPIIQIHDTHGRVNFKVLALCFEDNKR